MLGRDAELALASRRLNEAAAGRGGVLLIEGEPGIGKSALAAALAEDARSQGYSVASGRALELSSAPPWLPLSPCLRSIGIARVLLPVDAQEVYGLWEDVLAALSDAAQRRPILWLLEDLHAADVQTLDLLSFLAHPLRALRVLVVVTARAVDPLLMGAVADRLGRLGRAGDVVSLGPLADDAITGLVQQVATRSLSPVRVRELVAHAKGHPLFALELARAEGTPRANLPSTVVQVVQERLALLPPATRAALEHAAVFGREVSAGNLGRLMQRLPAAVIDDLSPSLRAGLLEELAPGRFQFSHALVREAIHDAFSLERRCHAHAKAERLLSEDPETLERLLLRASHALEARDAIDGALAADVIARAVAALSADGAHDRAFALYRPWVESLPRAAESPVLLHVARLAAAAGNFAECTRFANEALARGQGTDDAALVGEAALVLGTNLRPAIVDRQLVRALEDALLRLSRDAHADPALRCRVRARLSAALQPAIDFSVPVAMARAAIDEARQIADPRLIRDVLFVAGSALTSCVPPLETCELATELVERARESEDVPLMLRAQVRRIMHLIELGKLEVFGKELDELLLLAESAGLPAQMWRPLLVGSLRALAQGNFMESERLLGEVEELGGLTDDPALAFGLRAHNAMRVTALEDVAGMRAARDAYATLLPQTGPQLAVRAQLLAHLALRLGDGGAAAAELDEMMRAVSTPPDAFLPAVAGEVAALFGSTEQCRVVQSVLEPMRNQWTVSSQVDFFFGGPIERVLGLLESALGEHDKAIASLANARERCARHGLRPWIARIGLELGRAQLAANRTSDALATLASALEHADALPMPLTAQRIREQLQPLRASVAVPAAVSAPVVAQPGSLAALERQGDVWRARYAGREVLLKDSRGIQLLSRLIAAPGERVHALALASDDGATLGESNSGAALDATALKRYRARLSELDEEIAAAESADAGARAQRLCEERDALTAELRRAVGLGGRLRKVGSTTERARVNVTRRLREAITRVGDAHPELGRHLSESIRTGTYCSFRP